MVCTEGMLQHSMRGVVDMNARRPSEMGFVRFGEHFQRKMMRKDQKCVQKYDDINAHE